MIDKLQKFIYEDNGQGREQNFKFFNNDYYNVNIKIFQVLNQIREMVKKDAEGSRLDAFRALADSKCNPGRKLDSPCCRLTQQDLQPRGRSGAGSLCPIKPITTATIVGV